MGLLTSEMQQKLAGLKSAGPPFICPNEGCDRHYKSMSGIRSHLATCQRSTDDTAAAASAAVDCSSSEPTSESSPPAMSWLQAQQNVDITVAGRLSTLSILEDLPIVSAPGGSQEEAKAEQERKESRPSRTVSNATPVGHDKQLPTGVYLNSKFRAEPAPPITDAYIRHADSVPEEADFEIGDNVEYDMDDEDACWLQTINNRRLSMKLSKVPESIFEYLIDRLEKESFFQSPAGQPDSLVDDDAVCCVCNDGECENTNFILFCDMCNLAVHQECYGVPYIPEGQWLCKRCLLSPSQPVPCCLCPNLGGAMKQTTDDRWAHVACALWIPEVHFSNSVFLEPIDGIQKVPIARRRLVCYICKQRDLGACIQCNKSSCYTAFHVTCALSAGLHLKLEMDYQRQGSIQVHKTAFCDVHTPNMASSVAGSGDHCDSDQLAARRQRVRKARKLLVEKRMPSFAILLPTIPEHRLSKIVDCIKMSGKDEFLDRIKAYWMLKRRSRFGVPLLRRLQINQQKSGLATLKNQGSQMKQYAMVWNKCRNSLEMGRLLLELLRKREKIELDIAVLRHKSDQHKLWPLVTYMLDVLDRLDKLDEDGVFAEPVDCTKVRGYLKIIQHPMDLSTMRKKVHSLQYATMTDFQRDFKLMVDNCLMFNQGNQYFYDQGLRMQDLGGKVVQRALDELEKYDMNPLFDDSDSDDQMNVDSPMAADCSRLLSTGHRPAATPTPSPAADRRPLASSTKRRRLGSGQASPKPNGWAHLNGLGLVTASSQPSSTTFGELRNDTCSPAVESDVDGSLMPSPACSLASPGSMDLIQSASPEHLDLVWARTAPSEPWLPGMVIDPRAKNKDNSMDIPIPSDRVLRCRRSPSCSYLVYLFCSQKPWMWLSKDQLRPLGLNSNFDNICLRDTAKVVNADDLTAAYAQAMKYKCIITGDSIASCDRRI